MTQTNPITGRCPCGSGAVYLECCLRLWQAQVMSEVLEDPRFAGAPQPLLAGEPTVETSDGPKPLNTVPEDALDPDAQISVQLSPFSREVAVRVGELGVYNRP